MIRGFSPESEIGQLAARLNSVSDNGIRGHLLPTADLSAVGYSFYSQLYLDHDFSWITYLPIFSMKLKNVNFKDLTQGITAQDVLVKENLTNDFANIVRRLGGLDLGGWQRAGLGDLVSFIEWSKDYPQNKPWLKNVHVDARGGFTFPTGVQKEEDKLFSIPFGNDGSLGLLFGGGIDLRWGCYLQAGVDLEFLKLFGNTKDRRIKTDKDQTDLVLLAKTKVFKECGILQRYNLYIEAYKFYKGLSLRAAYQFLKRGDDKLWLFDNQFSSNIANTGNALEDWTIHELIFFLKYDFANQWKDQRFVPNFALFYKVPFNGTRSLQSQTLGIEFSISF